MIQVHVRRAQPAIYLLRKSIRVQQVVEPVLCSAVQGEASVKGLLGFEPHTYDRRLNPIFSSADPFVGAGPVTYSRSTAAAVLAWWAVSDSVRDSRASQSQSRLHGTARDVRLCRRFASLRVQIDQAACAMLRQPQL